MRIFRFLLFLLCIRCCAYADGDLFSARMSIISSPVTIPDQLKVEVALAYPKGYHVEWEAVRRNLIQGNNPLFQPFRLISQVISSPEEIDGSIIQKAVYILDPLIPGPQVLSLLNVTFLPNDGEKLKPVDIFVDFQTVEVELPAFDPHYSLKPLPPMDLTQRLPVVISESNRISYVNGPKLLEEEAIRNVTIFKNRSFPWKTFWTGVVFLTLITVFRHRIWSHIKASFLELITMPPGEKASRSLAKLKQKDLPQRGQVDEYFVELSSILRKFLEEGLKLKALEKTTKEFLQDKKTKTVLSKDKRKMLLEVLEKADAVKFAKASVGIEDCNQAEQVLETFIRPQPEVQNNIGVR